MKRIITVCLLIMAVITGSFSIDAKTTSKKRSKAKTSQSTRPSSTPKEFGVELFLEQDGISSNGTEDFTCYTFRSGIGTSLKKLGFIKTGEKYKKDGIEVELTEVKFKNLYYTTGVSINFPNSNERDRFIELTKPLGFVWDGLECTNGWNKTMAFFVDDNFLSMTLIP